MNRVFMRAAWRHLIMANYAVPVETLMPYLPAHTMLDDFDGQYYVSLVGFMFEKVRIKGISIPFHTHFPEVNLRFYVKHQAVDGTIRRGVVFLSEVVPRPAIAWVANRLYGEKYIATKMNRVFIESPDQIDLKYSWRWQGRENFIAATLRKQLTEIAKNSPEEFIFEHYYGYASMSESITNEYRVEHPRWNVYPVESFEINCAFEAFYGNRFAFLDGLQTASVFVAEGSDVVIREKNLLV